MAIIKSDAAKGLFVPPNAHLSGVENVARYSYAFTATANSVGDIIELACIPAGHIPVEVIAISDDIDTNGAPAVVFDVGIMSGKWQEDDAARTCGAEFFSASTLGQAGGVARPTLAGAYRVASSNKHRSIGVKITTAQATAAAGTLTLIVRTTPAP